MSGVDELLGLNSDINKEAKKDESVVSEATLQEANSLTKEAQQINFQPVVKQTGISLVSQQLNEDELAKAKQLASQMNIKTVTDAINVGSELEAHNGEFSMKIAEGMRVKDSGEVGEQLNELMLTLENTNANSLFPKDSFFGKLFNKAKTASEKATSQYREVSATVDVIKSNLIHSKNELLSDITELDNLYKQNNDYYDALSIMISALEMKIDEFDSKIIPEYTLKAKQTGDQMDAQDANDMISVRNKLDVRRHNMYLVREVIKQNAPQIRLVQNTNQTLAEKIQSSVNTAIPLWQNQIAIAVALDRQKAGLEAQKKVSETTNKLLLGNAKMLKQTAIETAIENERGIIDAETIQQSQQMLIETLEGVKNAQLEGSRKRKEAEVILEKSEQEMRNKMLQLTTDFDNKNQQRLN